MAVQISRYNEIAERRGEIADGTGEREKEEEEEEEEDVNVDQCTRLFAV